MIIKDKTLPYNIDTVLGLLQHQTDACGCFFDLDMIHYHQARFMLQARDCARLLQGALSIPTVPPPTQREFWRTTLRQRLGLPEEKLPNTSKATLKILSEDPALSEEAKEILSIYKTYSRSEYLISYLDKYMQLPLAKLPDIDGHRMVVAHPIWSRVSTSRFTSQDPPVQNIAKEIADIVTAPKGYMPIFSDSGQIEPRITYSCYIKDPVISRLITLYDDAYYGQLHYITMSDEELKVARNDPSTLVAHPTTDEMKKGRSVLKTLGLAGNYGSANLGHIDAELGPLYAKRIVNHPLRAQWSSEVAAYVNGGGDVFYGYFGTPVYPDETVTYKRGGSGWTQHLIRCGINNPIQTTAAELMCFSIMEALDRVQGLGWISSWKHDEGCFVVQEDMAEYLGPALQDCLSYEVEGWIPINSDLIIGRKEVEDSAVHLL